jgi:hypothetical protein
VLDGGPISVSRRALNFGGWRSFDRDRRGLDRDRRDLVGASLLDHR